MNPNIPIIIDLLSSIVVILGYIILYYIMYDFYIRNKYNSFSIFLSLYKYHIISL